MQYWEDNNKLREIRSDQKKKYSKTMQQYNNNRIEYRVAHKSKVGELKLKIKKVIRNRNILNKTEKKKKYIRDEEEGKDKFRINIHNQYKKKQIVVSGKKKKTIPKIK